MKLNLTNSLKYLERIITDNSPMILTGLGVVGVGVTTALSVQAGFKAQTVLQDEAGKQNLQREAGEDYMHVSDFTRKEKLELTWKLYLAPFASAALTACAIVGAQKINGRRAAAIAGVLALTQDDLKSYKDKIQDKLTGPAYKKVNDEIAQEKFDSVYQSSNVFVPPGKILCFEPYTGRLFASTRVEIERAEVAMQKKIHTQDAASLSDFYDLIHQPHTAMSDSYGWNTTTSFELDFTSVVTDDETATALAVNYVEPPMYRPWEAGSFR